MKLNCLHQYAKLIIRVIEEAHKELQETAFINEFVELFASFFKKKKKKSESRIADELSIKFTPRNKYRSFSFERSADS